MTMVSSHIPATKIISSHTRNYSSFISFTIMFLEKDFRKIEEETKKIKLILAARIIYLKHRCISDNARRENRLILHISPPQSQQSNGNAIIIQINVWFLSILLPRPVWGKSSPVCWLAGQEGACSTPPPWEPVSRQPVEVPTDHRGEQGRDGDGGDPWRQAFVSAAARPSGLVTAASAVTVVLGDSCKAIPQMEPLPPLVSHTHTHLAPHPALHTFSFPVFPDSPPLASPPPPPPLSGRTELWDKKQNECRCRFASSSATYWSEATCDNKWRKQT